MATLGRRRALGQHFLKDQSICDQIAESAVEHCARYQAKALLEIGPGKGAITNPLRQKLGLLSQAPEFFVCERDARLTQHWRDEGIRVEEADFLDLPEDRWLGASPLVVVSNLPYSAGTAILTRLAARLPAEIPAMTLMFQAEVAQRLRAESSTKAWGSLSVWIQNEWDVTKLLSVKPGAFIPPPQVQSEVVTLIRRAKPRVPVSAAPEDQKRWENLLKTCFAHRRKMLRAGIPKATPIRNALEQSGVDDTKRAEALSWDEWSKLWEHLK